MRSKYTIYATLMVFAVVLLSGCTQNQTQQSVCNRPYILVGTECCLDQNGNNVCDKDEQTVKVQENVQSNVDTSKIVQNNDIEIGSLINFLESSVKSFPNSGGGVFFRWGDGDGCYEGFKKPCTSWLYPSEQHPADEVSALILDFGKGNSPSVNEVLNDQSDFTNIEKRTLSDGDILFQSYGPEDGDVGILHHIGVEVPCSDRYWITVSISDKQQIYATPFLAIASDILKFCA